MHAITILWTPRPIVADGNITVSCPTCARHTCNYHTKDSSPTSSRWELNQFHAHHVSNHQAHPRPLLDLVLQAQTPQTQAYNSCPLGNKKQTVHKHMTLHQSRLSRVSSLKLKPRPRLG